MLATTVFANLLVGAGLFFLPRRYLHLAKWIALAPATASLVISIAMSYTLSCR